VPVEEAVAPEAEIAADEESGAEAVEEITAGEAVAEPWEIEAEEPAGQEPPVADEGPAWQQPVAAAPEPTPWYRPAPVPVEPPPPPPAVAPPPAPPEPPPAFEPHATAPWQAPAGESVTSQIAPEPVAGPSEATVRISRDMLPSQAPTLGEADVSDDATVMLPRAGLVPPPSPEVELTRPTPVVEPARPHTTEVQPPPDLEGPGWAFRNEPRPAVQRAAPDEGASLHEEARRLARLLVSEIKLYNEEQVEEGRRHRDIYPRLQDDIDRSRQMYDERVDPRVKGEVDYFQQEVVNILAGGDAGALGM
jgi:hypothetical protein